MTETPTPYLPADRPGESWFERFVRWNWTHRRAIESRQESNERAEYWRQRFIMATGAAGEGGEILELLKKHARDGILDEHQLALEIGDVLVYLARIAQAHDLTLEDCQRLVVGKLKRRNALGKDPAGESSREELLHWFSTFTYQGVPVSFEPAVASDPRLARAVAYWRGTWPAQLEGGVMFYEGLRITRGEFEAAARDS